MARPQTAETAETKKHEKFSHQEQRTPQGLIASRINGLTLWIDLMFLVFSQ